MRTNLTPAARGITVAVMALLPMLAAAQDPLTTRCESAPILTQFTVFSETGRMPPDLVRFLADAALQKVEPYKAFDNVYYVGICWVSAWLITSPRGHVLIDSLYEPYTDQLLDNIRRLGHDPKDIKLVVHDAWPPRSCRRCRPIEAVAPARHALRDVGRRLARGRRGGLAVHWKAPGR